MLGLKKNKSKELKKYFLILITFLIFVSIGNLTYASASTGDNDNIFMKMLNKTIFAIAKKIQDGLSGQTLDNLIYNKGTDYIGLLLFKKSDLQDFFISMYLAVKFLALAFLAPIMMSIGIHFRNVDDPQKKAQLKDKLLRVFLTFVWLQCMPTIITAFVTINDVIVAYFNSVGVTFFTNKAGVPNNGGSLVKAYLDKNYYKTGGDIVDSCVAFMLSGLNIWIMVYYFIRDITIAYLFILYPILAIFYPIDKSMMESWFKEMISNIFSQAIQALILTIAMCMAVFLPRGSLANGVYTIVAFALIIPMTGITKRFLKLEGSVGAASSMAGLGATFAALQLGGRAVGNLKQKAGMVKEGIGGLLEANSDQNALEKNLPISESDVQQLPNLNTNRVSLSTEDISKKRRESVSKIVKGTAGIAGGSFGAYAGGFMGLPMGMKTAMTTGSIGSMLASEASSFGANAAYRTGYAIDGALQEEMNIRNIENENGINREEAIEKYTGLTGIKMAGENFKSEEINAVRAKKLLNSMGFESVGNLAYNYLAPKRASNNEIKKEDEAFMYTDKNQSFIYKEKDGQKEVLWQGAGDSNLSSPKIQGINFKNDDIVISQERQKELDRIAKERASVLCENLGILEDDKNYGKKFRNIEQDEYRKLSNLETKKVDNIRKETGFSSLNFASSKMDYVTDEVPFQEMENIKHKDVEDLEEVYFDGTDSEYSGITLNNFRDEGTGYMISYDGGAVAYQNMEIDINGEKTIYARPMAYLQTKNKMGINSMAYQSVKFEGGKMYVDDTKKYVTTGTTFDDIPGSSMINTNKLDTIKSSLNLDDNFNNNEILITVANTEDAKNYNLVNNTTGEYIGSYNIPESLINVEPNQSSYHIKIDENGQWNQLYNGEIKDRDIARVISSKQNDFIESQKKVEYQKQLEIKNIEDYLRQAKLFYGNGEVDLKNELINSI